ncbi:MAG: hypothetical protein H6727_03875 [Myxococcales bacterium]|nr:hypothetical protein [Myxococcales bacterium]
MIEILEQIQMSIPSGFLLEESKVIFETEPTKDLYDPQLALLSKQLSKQKSQSEVVSNLLIKRKSVDPQINLPYLAMDLAAKSLHNMGSSLQDLQNYEFCFSDQKEGVLLSFSFPADKFQLRQYHVFRLDQDLLTHATWTCDHRTTTEQEQNQILATLAKIKPTP